MMFWLGLSLGACIGFIYFALISAGKEEDDQSGTEKSKTYYI
jgi:type III secretory pathway component EscT